MRRSLPLALIALLGGCATGPIYRAPAPADGVSGPLAPVDSRVETVAEPPGPWWRLYNDAKLDALLQEAFAANTDLAAAQANLAGARAVLEATRAGRLPNTTVHIGGTYGRDGSTDEILELTGRPPQTTWIYDDILDVSYELDLFGRVRRSIEASRADVAAADAARDAVKVTVAAETTRAYVQICALGEQLAVARRSLEVVSREADITRNRQREGAGSEFDIVRAEGLVAQVRSAIPPLEGQRLAALYQLAVLLGRAPSRAPVEAEACVAPPRLGSPLPVGDGETLLRRRPDVRQAERRLAAATARIGVTTADLYPRITLSGLYGGVAAKIPELVQNSGLTWGVGPGLSWTFPNQTLPRARIRQARAGAAADLALFDGAVLQALKETDQALAAYGAELSRHDDLRVVSEKAERALQLAQGQYLAGSLSTLDLLTAEQTTVSAEAALAASDSVLAQDQVAVFKALGGGWQTEAAARPG